MRIEWSKRHWIICTVLLATQVVGIALTSMRAPAAGPGWLNFGLFAVRHDTVSVVMFLPYVLGACMLITLVAIGLFEAVARHS